MRFSTGTIVSGQVVLDSDGIEGSRVMVIFADHAEICPLSREERAELDAGIAEADRGDTIPVAEPKF